MQSGGRLTALEFIISGEISLDAMHGHTWRLTTHRVRGLFLPSSGKKKVWDCSYLSSEAHYKWMKPLKTKPFEMREMMGLTCLGRRSAFLLRSIGLGAVGLRRFGKKMDSRLRSLKAYSSESPSSATVWLISMFLRFFSTFETGMQSWAPILLFSEARILRVMMVPCIILCSLRNKLGIPREVENHHCSTIVHHLTSVVIIASCGTFVGPKWSVRSCNRASVDVGFSVTHDINICNSARLCQLTPLCICFLVREDVGGMGQGKYRHSDLLHPKVWDTNSSRGPCCQDILYIVLKLEFSILWFTHYHGLSM